MVGIRKWFRKRDLLVLIGGVAIMQILVCMFVNRFMFYPVTDGFENVCGTKEFFIQY